MIRLDLGAGAVSPDGFMPLGHGHGSEIYPLKYADNSVDAVRCSHALEHISYREIPAVLADWVRVLKPGGVLRIAVPDFEKVVKQYLEGHPQPTEGYVMGGQVDQDDFHKAIFDAAHLKTMMGAAGLMLIREWKSELPDDCAALPISLNLEGTKPHMTEIGVSAVMSVPRLGFMDNFFACFEALPPLNVKIRRYMGAYWGQCIERVIEESITEDKPDAVLTLDYDTVFKRRDAAMLMQLMCCHPEADAIAAVQAGRGKEAPLFTIKGADGKNAASISAEAFEPDLAPVATAHFGLTLLRAEKFAALPKPWFHDVPAPDGAWGEGRRDADISFWDKWIAAGNSLFIANRVPVGHLELAVRWPGKDLRAIHQDIGEWREKGPPTEAWR